MAWSIDAALASRRRRWLVTGAAGFIGSHLVEQLLGHGQDVVGLDNFATGSRRNLELVRAAVPQAAEGFTFIEGDIRDRGCCAAACRDVEIVLHQAALGSVPRSIEDPLLSNDVNVGGFLTMLVAAKDARVRRFVYASSSAVFGDSAELPKVEDRIGRPLSPYAVTKCVDELYAGVAAGVYNLPTIGLRYFNVFGPRQSPQGAYAAVIPRWIAALVAGKECVIYGDGETSRDFCYVLNVVQANLRAALVEREDALNRPYNIAVGGRTTLSELHAMLAAEVARCTGKPQAGPPRREAFRSGDVRHSHADISRAATLLGYAPTHTIAEGIAETVRSFVEPGTSAGLD